MSPENLQTFLDGLVVGPVWPASFVAGLLLIYTVAAVLGLIDLDFGSPDLELPDLEVPDLELPELELPELEVPELELPNVASPELEVPPAGVDAPASSLDGLHGLGAAAIRTTNFGRLPLVIWGSIFAVFFWCVSYGLWHGWDHRRYDVTWTATTLLSLRNLVISLAVVKTITQPMLPLFERGPVYDSRYLLGATCQVSTSTATQQFGQAKFRTNAAPLLLNVRTDGETIPRGSEARIVAFDPNRRIYTIQPVIASTHRSPKPNATAAGLPFASAPHGTSHEPSRSNFDA